MNETFHEPHEHEIAAAMAAIAAARAALTGDQPPAIEIMLRVGRAIAAIGRWHRPADDLSIALASELQSLSERLQAALAATRSTIRERTQTDAALHAYGAGRKGR